METSKTKTVRFSQVVRGSGEPELVTLWQGPEQDRKFQKALRENRVMTVTQDPVGTRKDFGLVGYGNGRGASFLVFPKNLNRFREVRVVGIKYELLAPTRPVGTPVKKPKREHERRPPADHAKKKPGGVNAGAFRVVVRCIAIVDVEERVEARNRSAAREEAMRRVGQRAIDFGQANVTRKVTKLEKL